MTNLPNWLPDNNDCVTTTVWQPLCDKHCVMTTVSGPLCNHCVMTRVGIGILKYRNTKNTGKYRNSGSQNAENFSTFNLLNPDKISNTEVQWYQKLTGNPEDTELLKLSEFSFFWNFWKSFGIFIIFSVFLPELSNFRV